MKKVQNVIAIDGPSGSGKSTLAALLAQKLGFIYIDTGAMFRALGLWAQMQNVSLFDESALKELLDSLNLEYAKSDSELVCIDGVNLTSQIRNHEVSALASQISQRPVVREYLLNFQRTLAQKNICVMEGRDIGTIVFPNAFCKLFITASVEVRSTRRQQQLAEGGTKVDFEQVLKDVKKRDQLDIERPIAPLKKADDAILIDSSELGPDEVLAKMKEYCFEQANFYNIKL